MSHRRLLSYCRPHGGDSRGTENLYWPAGGALTFGLLAWWYSRHAKRVGIGSEAQPYAFAGMGLAVVLLWGPVSLLIPIAALGLGLAVIARRQRNRLLGFWAFVLIVVGAMGANFLVNGIFHVLHGMGLETPGAETSYDVNAFGFYAGLGILLCLAGLRARTNEQV